MLHCPADIVLPTTGPWAGLAKLAYPFHLTGSRFMGTATSTSDWDFVTTNNPFVQRDLLALGFRDRWAKKKPYDRDQHTVTVFEHDGPPLVQVQLTDNLAAKLYARNEIKAHHLLLHDAMPDDQRVHLWNGLYHQFANNGGPLSSYWDCNKLVVYGVDFSKELF